MMVTTLGYEGEELPEMTEEETMTDSTAMQSDSAAMAETQPVTE